MILAVIVVYGVFINMDSAVELWKLCLSQIDMEG